MSEIDKQRFLGQRLDGPGRHWKQALDVCGESERGGDETDSGDEKMRCRRPEVCLTVNVKRHAFQFDSSDQKKYAEWNSAAKQQRTRAPQGHINRPQHHTQKDVCRPWEQGE